MYSTQAMAPLGQEAHGKSAPSEGYKLVPTPLYLLDIEMPGPRSLYADTDAPATHRGQVECKVT